LYREIRLESLKAHPEYFESSYQEQKKLPRLMFEKAIEQPQDERFVLGAFDKDQIVGICGFVYIKNQTNAGLRNVGSLIQLYVKPEYRGMGVGLYLVEYLIEEGFQIPGIEHIVLEVSEDNQPAIRIYEQAGFVPYDAVISLGKQSTPGSLRMIHNGVSTSTKNNGIRNDQ
jgi:ribosomal protein S18 acetylase RimI-like enzyme